MSRERKPPMTADAVREYIAKLDRECRSKAARIRMAELAIKAGNISPEGIQLWRDYLATQA